MKVCALYYLLDHLFSCMSDSLTSVLLFVKLESQKSELADSRCRVKAFAFDRIYWSVDPTAPNFVTQEMVSSIGLLRIISCSAVCWQVLPGLYVCVDYDHMFERSLLISENCLLYKESFSLWFCLKYHLLTMLEALRNQKSLQIFRIAHLEQLLLLMVNLINKQ